jgi:hypothetical protein
MAKWHLYTTDFPGTALPSGFFGYGTRTVSGNKLRFPITGSNFAGATRHGDDLLDSHVLVRAEPGATGVCAVDAYDGGTIRMQMRFNSGQMQCSIGGTQLYNATYDATAHAWWRLREAAGTAYCETAPDGNTWTVRASAATPAGLDTADIDLNAGGGSATSEAAFSKFNLPPAGGGSAVTGTADFTGQAALTLAAAGVRGTAGTATVAGDALSLVGAGTRGAGGSASLVLGGLALTAQGQRGVQGTAAVTAGALGLSATGQRGVVGTASLVGGGLVLVATNAAQDVTGTAVVQGGALALTATGRRGVRGVATVAAGPLILMARGPIDVVAQRVALRQASISAALSMQNRHVVELEQVTP